MPHHDLGTEVENAQDALKDIFERVSAVPTRNIVGFVIVSHWQGGGRGKIASMSSRISTAATLDVLVPSCNLTSLNIRSTADHS